MQKAVWPSDVVLIVTLKTLLASLQVLCNACAIM